LFDFKIIFVSGQKIEEQEEQDKKKVLSINYMTTFLKVRKT
jgi:hypothetical protein